MMTQLDRAALWAGLAWCGVGLGCYALYGRRHFSPGALSLAAPAQPSPAERRRMDRQYRRWRAAVLGAAAGVLLLFLVPFLLR